MRAQYMLLFSLNCHIRLSILTLSLFSPVFSRCTYAVDLAVAFDSAVAVAFGWCLASAVSGVCAQNWLSLDTEEHTSSALGAKGVLANWIIAWPLGEVLRFIALFGLVGGQIDGEWALAAESVRDGLLTLPSLVGNAALDGAGVLLALTLWRRWLLAYMWGM